MDMFEGGAPEGAKGRGKGKKGLPRTVSEGYSASENSSFSSIGPASVQHAFLGQGEEMPPHRASAPAALELGEPKQDQKAKKNAKKTVAFGYRYSIVMGSDNFSSGRRVSDVERQKQVNKMQRWLQDRSRLGYDEPLHELLPGEPDEFVGLGRPRSRSTFEDDIAGDCQPPVGRARSRSDFCADSTGGYNGCQDLPKETARDSERAVSSGGVLNLEDFIAETPWGTCSVEQSLDDFLGHGMQVSLTDFLETGRIGWSMCLAAGPRPNGFGRLVLHIP
ncbi:unnamed protein product [Effrenium voratum]|nr:unnamed protein product [Effrenium voratum]